MYSLHRVPRRTLEEDPIQQPTRAPNKEIRRRTDVVGIFPDRGAVLAEQHEEWACGRRCISAESLAKARLSVIAGGDQLPHPPEVTLELSAAQ